MRILSGVQPSGKLHLGNYFGAIHQHIALQVYQFHIALDRRSRQIACRRNAFEFAANVVRRAFVLFLRQSINVDEQGIAGHSGRSRQKVSSFHVVLSE